MTGKYTKRPVTVLIWCLFSFHNNSAGGESSFVGPAGAWKTGGGNRLSNYSFLHLSLLSRPTIAHTLEIQPIESWWNPSTTIASILVMQPLLCSSDCSWLNARSDTERLTIIGISIMQSIYNVASCMKQPICKNKWNTDFIWTWSWWKWYKPIIQVRLPQWISLRCIDHMTVPLYIIKLL